MPDKSFLLPLFLFWKKIFLPRICTNRFSRRRRMWQRGTNTRGRWYCFRNKRKRIDPRCAVARSILFLIIQKYVFYHTLLPFSLLLVMEQTDSCKCHRNIVFITCINDIVITDGSARLCDILHTALMSTLYIVPEREERIRSKCHTGIFI